DRAMEGQGRGDGVVVGGRMSADLLVLADVLVERRGGTPPRPDRLQLRLADVEGNRPGRGPQPPVPAAPPVNTLQGVAPEWEMGERMGAVDEDRDALRPAQPHDVADRQDLAG